MFKDNVISFKTLSDIKRSYLILKVKQQRKDLKFSMSHIASPGKGYFFSQFFKVEF